MKLNDPKRLNVIVIAKSGRSLGIEVDIRKRMKVEGPEIQT